MNAVTVPLRRLGKSSREREEGQPQTPSNVYLLDDELQVVRFDSSGVSRPVTLPGSLVPHDLCVTRDDVLYVLTRDERDTSAVWRADNVAATHWTEMPLGMGLRRIACGPDGVLWGIDDALEVWSFRFGAQPDEWIREGEKNFAEEISVGGDGRVWVVSTEERYAGRVVRWRARGDQAWTSLPAPSSAVKLAAAPDGVAWTINSMGAIWRLHPLGSGNFAECQVDTDCDRCIFGGRRDFAKDIAVDGNGSVWALSLDSVQGGYQLLRLTDKSSKRFERVAVGGIRLCAG